MSMPCRLATSNSHNPLQKMASAGEAEQQIRMGGPTRAATNELIVPVPLVEP